MKVAYVFATTGHSVSYKLGRMILPQLEENRHGVEVVGMFFFRGQQLRLAGRRSAGGKTGKGRPEKQHPLNGLRPVLL